MLLIYHCCLQNDIDNNKITYQIYAYRIMHLLSVELDKSRFIILRKGKN